MFNKFASSSRGCGPVVEHSPSRYNTLVPSPAPRKNKISFLYKAGLTFTTNLKKKKRIEKLEHRKNEIEDKKSELSFISFANSTHVLKFHQGRETVYIWSQDHLALANFSNVKTRMFLCHKSAPTSVLPKPWNNTYIIVSSLVLSKFHFCFYS